MVRDRGTQLQQAARPRITAGVIAAQTCHAELVPAKVARGAR